MGVDVRPGSSSPLGLPDCWSGDTWIVLAEPELRLALLFPAVCTSVTWVLGVPGVPGVMGLPGVWGVPEVPWLLKVPRVPGVPAVWGVPGVMGVPGVPWLP